MKSLLVVLLALTFVASSNIVFGENTFFDSVKFIQYLDENTVLEEVRNGNIDIYYYRISSDRLENPGDRERLQVFDSTGGSYSLLINPAESDRFNPFSEKDASLVKEYLIKFKEKSHIPSALEIFEKNSEYYELRYESSINWIENNNHAVISNGPFYLESYSPESRTITVNSFDDKTYPFSVGHCSEFENTKIPKIMKAEIPDIVNKESEFEMNIQTLQDDSILYFLSNSNGEIICSNSIEVKSDIAKIIFPSNIIEKLDIGTNNLKVFAISEKVLKPDYYEKSFLVTEKNEILPETKFDELQLILTT